MDGREIRLKRLLGNGRAVIVAIDHGMFDGPIPAMEDLPATAAKINPTVDAVLLAPGMLRHCHSIFAGRKTPAGRRAAELEHGLLLPLELSPGAERLCLRGGRRPARRDGHCPGLADASHRKRRARRGQRRGVLQVDRAGTSAGHSGHRRVFSHGPSRHDARSNCTTTCGSARGSSPSWGRT